MKINKNTLINFIKKYHLGNKCNSVQWEILDNTLTIRFLTESEETFGELTLNDFNFPNQTFGVYMTDLLINRLSKLEDSIDISIDADENDDPFCFKIVDDKKNKRNYILSTIDIIKSAPKSVNEPDYNTEIKIDSDFIKAFTNNRSSMSEINNVAITTKDDTALFIFGYSNTATDTASFPVSTIKNDKNLSPSSYFADVLNSILSVNADLKDGIMYISEHGLIKLVFNFENGTSKYFTTKLQD